MKEQNLPCGRRAAVPDGGMDPRFLSAAAGSTRHTRSAFPPLGAVPGKPQAENRHTPENLSGGSQRGKIFQGPSGDRLETYK
jgi:hypothetical protein